MPSPKRRPATEAPPASCPKTYPLGRPHWLPAFSTISASPCEIVPKNRCPASMTSFEEYCPRRTASRRRIRLREGRFAAPRDEGQNEEGGPHHSLHRALHSQKSCSTVIDEIVQIQYLLPHAPRAPREQ